MTPEITKLLTYQKNALLINSAVSTVAGIAIAVTFVNNAFAAIIAAVVVTWAFTVLLNNATAFILQWMIYRGDYEALERDLQEANDELQAELDGLKSSTEEPEEQQDAETFMLNIVNQPERPIARYMDEDIYEWLEFETTAGVPQRFIFEGTRPYTEGELADVPADCILIPPGILYKLEESQNAGILKAVTQE